MADVKISALPAATTPLTGSEVLPIVQGGTTDKVSVANLTAGRTVNASEFAASGTVSGATVSGTTVTVGAGTAAAPSIAPTGDSNTGIFFPAADTIAFSEGGVEALRLDSSGNATFAGTAAMASSFLRNRIINGGMDVNQRNAGNTFNCPDGQVTYGIDRFYVYTVGAALTGQRVNPNLTGFPNALRVTSTGAVAFVDIGQRIESANIADLAGSTVTISFRAASSSVTSLNIYTSYANSQDNFSGTTNIGTTTISITNTLTRYAVSFALPSQAANGLVVAFSMGALPNGNTFTLTGVQLEVGTAATPFERRPFGTELMLCQRYYQTSGLWSNYTLTFGQTMVNNIGLRGVAFITTMRTTPTVTTFSEAGVAGRFSINRGGSFVGGLVVDGSGFTLTNATGGNITATEITFTYTASAEL